MYSITTPQTEEDFKRYFHFRWLMLRKPLNLPEGSEKDGYDSFAHHQMIIDQDGQPIAIGRLYINADNEGAIRFMAVAPEMRGKGLGRFIAQNLESYAREQNLKRLVCNAREDAIQFFEQLGFIEQGVTIHQQHTPLRHVLMVKPLEGISEHFYRQAWCVELQNEWHQTIPLSNKMNIRITHYNGSMLNTQISVDGNQNPHHTLFAGSLFSQATLTGWGLIWLMMKEQNLDGTIILTESSIRYHKPIKTKPIASTTLDTLSGDLLRLTRKKVARLNLEVQLLDDSLHCATFTGTYLVLPKSYEQKQEND